MSDLVGWILHTSCYFRSIPRRKHFCQVRFGLCAQTLRTVKTFAYVRMTATSQFFGFFCPARQMRLRTIAQYHSNRLDSM
jgi:hypothetical protein